MFLPEVQFLFSLFKCHKSKSLGGKKKEEKKTDTVEEHKKSAVKGSPWEGADASQL